MQLWDLGGLSGTGLANDDNWCWLSSYPVARRSDKHLIHAYHSLLLGSHNI